MRHERVEGWLANQQQPMPTAQELAKYIVHRAERDYPGNESTIPPTPAGQPPYHDWLRHAALALAKQVAE